MTQHIEVGRLAMRREGNYWKAYFAQIGTMDNAIFLASIRFDFIEDNETIKEQFIEIVQCCVSDIVEKISSVRPDWADREPAPEHERGGNS